MLHPECRRGNCRVVVIHCVPSLILLVFAACTQRSTPIIIDEDCTQPITFSSANGKFAVRSETSLVGTHLNGHLTLFGPGSNGVPAARWSCQLPFAPSKVLVNDEGRVVTIDECNRHGAAHAIVVFADDGTVLAEYALSDVLTARERERCNPDLQGGYEWFHLYSHRLEGDMLLLERANGTRIAVRLSTGRLEG